jgi:hypothetical protein
MLSECSELDVNLLTYCILHLLKCEEYSVRDFTLHALAKLLPRLDHIAFKACEKLLINSIKTIRDEMILKSLLAALKLSIWEARTNPEKLKGSLSLDLVPLLQDQAQNSTNEDFFSQIVSM